MTRLQTPVHENGRIYVIEEDGSRRPIAPLASAEMERQWRNVNLALMVWQDAEIRRMKD